MTTLWSNQLGLQASRQLEDLRTTHRVVIVIVLHLLQLFLHLRLPLSFLPWSAAEQLPPRLSELV
jgi:hypothetical protein